MTDELPQNDSSNEHPDQRDHLPVVNETETFRLESSEQIEGMVQKVLSGEQLTQSELHDLQERKIKSLDPIDRDRIRGVREKLGQLAERFGETLKGMYLRASRKEIQVTQLDVYTDAAREEFTEDAKYLRTTADRLQQQWDEQQKIAYQEMWQDASGGEVVKVDPFTGLKTRDSLLGRLGDNMANWRKTGDDRWLQKTRVRAGDLDNFKQGNDILGHDGFDKHLRDDLAERFKQLAIFMGSSVYEDELRLELIDQMFPEGSSERQMLDQLKGKMVIDSYRMKAGADEIFIAYEKVDIELPEDEFDQLSSIGDILYDHVLHSSVIGRYEKLEETTIIRDKFILSPVSLKVEASDIKKGDFSMVPYQAEYWNDLGGEISEYLQLSGIGDPIITNDPPATIRMGAGITPPRNLREGIHIYLYGKDFTGKDVPSDKLRGGAGYMRDPLLKEERDKSVLASATRRLASVGASDEQDVKKAIERSAVDKVDGYFLQMLMSEADDVSKPRGKRDMVLRAWTAKPGTIEAGELALQLGSLAVAGRLEKAVATRDDRVRLIEQTSQILYDRGYNEALKVMNAISAKGMSIPDNDSEVAASAQIIHQLAAEGKIDKFALYAYYGIHEKTTQYMQNIDQQAEVYKASGVEITAHHVGVKLPFDLDGMFMAIIKQARDIDMKEKGIR